MIYKILAILSVIIGLIGCRTNNFSNQDFAYQIQGITAYKGQDVSSLFDSNGAPNIVKRLSNNKIMWIYYTNYRPVGGGELISYDEPTNLNNTTTCAVRVILNNNEVEQVLSNCS